MSIATVAEVNWNGTIDSDNKIGISDTLDNLSVDVWSDDSVFVTAYKNPWVKYYRKTTGYPAVASKTDEAPWYLSYRTGYSNVSNNFDGEIYLRSVLLAVPNDYNYSNWNTGLGGMLRNTDNRIRIITSLSVIKNNISVYLTKVGDACRSPVYFVNESIAETTAVGTFTYDDIVYKIVCADIYVDEDNFFVNIPTALPFNLYDTANGDGIMGMWAYSAITNKMLSLSPQFFEEDDKAISIASTGYYNVNTWHYHALPTSDDNVFYADYIGGWHLDSYANEYYHLMNTARFGMYFTYGGDNYKPIISQGVVTGYTTTMDTPSDIDNWTDISGHNISPTPPTPSEDDSYADMGIGVGTGVGGYTSFALMTMSDLIDLLADFNANLVTGMSVVNNFICLYKLGPLASYLCSTRVGNIIMSANASNNFVSIRADYNIVTSQKSSITLGSYNVPRMTNTFYDFAPYSTYELFIPCCGWVPLPDTVAGRTIDVYMIIDLSSCTCKGVCRINGTTVAEASGVLGVSVPFFSTDSGLKRAADVMAITQVIGGMAQGAVGANSGSGALVVSGSMNAVQGLEQLYINGNTNYTAIKGGNGDITAVGNGEYCTIKITHPEVDEVVNNSRFGHSVGYLCNTVGKIKEFKGLTVCANPHVTGINCTESEKEEIKRLLEEGIIVN